MNFFTAIILYLTALFSVLQGWLLLAIVAILIFSFYFSPAWLIPSAILIDGYTGSFFSVPELSFLALTWFVVVEFIRPKLVDFKNR